MSSRGYKLTEIGEIPEDWEAVRLGEITQIFGGSTPSTNMPDYWDGDIPFVVPTDITKLSGSNFLRDTAKKITRSGLASISARILPPGSVLISSRASIGFCAINEVAVVTNQGFASLVCGERAHNLYILHLIRFLRKRLEQLASGSTFKEISRKSLRKLLIPLPPLPEQRKIAVILSVVHDAIQKTDEIIAKTQQLKKGLMQRLFTRGIGHTKFKQTEIGEMPERWDVMSINDISVEGTRNGLYKPKNFFGQGVRVVRMTELFRDDVLDVDSVPERVDLTDSELSRFALHEGDLLFARRSMKVEGSGRCVMVPALKEPIAFESSIVRVTPDKNRAHPKFLLYYLTSSFGRKSIMRIVRTVAVSGVTGEDLSQILVPVPALDEQKQITRILASVDEKVAIEEKRKSQLEQLKKGLMQGLLTGKVRVGVS
jgi:type I restriction enzyme S subunit